MPNMEPYRLQETSLSFDRIISINCISISIIPFQFQFQFQFQVQFHCIPFSISTSISISIPISISNQFQYQIISISISISLQFQCHIISIWISISISNPISISIIWNDRKWMMICMIEIEWLKWYNLKDELVKNEMMQMMNWRESWNGQNPRHLTDLRSWLRLIKMTGTWFKLILNAFNMIRKHPKWIKMI